MGAARGRTCGGWTTRGWGRSTGTGPRLKGIAGAGAATGGAAGRGGCAFGGCGFGGCGFEGCGFGTGTAARGAAGTARGICPGAA
jgi:hypothetical protein